MTKIKWGIIGLGGIARKFAKDLTEHEDAELIAVASRSIEKANEFASAFNVEHAYGNYEALLENK
jgi:predicted dehydrogenase